MCEYGRDAEHATVGRHEVRTARRKLQVEVMSGHGAAAQLLLLPVIYLVVLDAALSPRELNLVTKWVEVRVHRSICRHAFIQPPIL